MTNNNKLKGVSKKNRVVRFVVFTMFSILLVSFVYIFGRYFDNQKIKIQTKMDLKSEEYLYLIDFESNRFLANASAISHDKFLSGSNSGKLQGFKSYSPSVNIKFPTNDSTLVDDLNIKFWLNPSSSKVKASLVFSIIDQNNNQIHWEGYQINEDNLIADNWQPFQHVFTIPPSLISVQNTIKVYLWNQDDSDNPVYIDDITISLRDDMTFERPRSKFVDFEKHNSKKISTKYSVSGFNSTYAAGKDGFSEAIKIPMKDIKYDNLSSIAYSFNYLCEKPVVDAAFVLSITDTLGNDVLWQSTHLSFTNKKTEVWDIGNGNAVIPQEAIDSTYTIKVYLWNRNDNTIYIDDVYLVIKENDASREKDPAYNLLHSSDFKKQTNHPPYELLFLSKYTVNDISKLTNAFTTNSINLVGDFVIGGKDEIVSIKNDEVTLSSFNDNNLKVSNINGIELPSSNFKAFADESYVFIADIGNGELSQYVIKDDLFVMVLKVFIPNLNNLLEVIVNNNGTISLLYHTGTIVTYNLVDGEGYLLNSKSLLNPDNGNVKIYKGKFLSESNQILTVYSQNGIDKYQIFDFVEGSNTWRLSGLHSNSSSQGYDKLSFSKDYYVCNSGLENNDMLLMFSKKRKFSLRLLGFNKMSYEVFNDIEFFGYYQNQNPKYYEITQLVLGDFVGDERTDIMIFQDNNRKIDWLSQKLEVYTFK